MNAALEEVGDVSNSQVQAPAKKKKKKKKKKAAANPDQKELDEDGLAGSVAGNNHASHMELPEDEDEAQRQAELEEQERKLEEIQQK